MSIAIAVAIVSVLGLLGIPFERLVLRAHLVEGGLASGVIFLRELDVALVGMLPFKDEERLLPAEDVLFRRSDVLPVKALPPPFRGGLGLDGVDVPLLVERGLLALEVIPEGLDLFLGGEGPFPFHLLVLPQGHPVPPDLEGKLGKGVLRAPHGVLLVPVGAGKADVVEREGDVLLDGEVRVEGVVLEDEADPAVLRRDVGDFLLPEINMPPGRLMKSGDHVERRGLAASRGAEETDQLAVRNRKRHAVDRGHVRALVAPEDLGELFDLDFHPVPPGIATSSVRARIARERGCDNKPPLAREALSTRAIL